MVNAGRTVLVVESDPQALAAAVTLVESAGHHVVSATTFEDATRLLAAAPPDLLVTELRLGLYNGLHLLLRSRSKHPDMPAIVMTRYPDPVLQAETERLNAVYFESPVDTTRFLAALSTLLPPGII